MTEQKLIEGHKFLFRATFGDELHARCTGCDWALDLVGATWREAEIQWRVVHLRSLMAVSPPRYGFHTTDGVLSDGWR